jgi:hypothetical protein
MVVIGDGGYSGGSDGGDGIVTESIGLARKETCSGKASKTIALSMSRPSQSKQDLPLFGDWMMHFCTNFCTSLTGSNRATRLRLLATLNSSSLSSVSSLLSVSSLSIDASVAVCIACEVATVNVAPEV